MENSWSQSRDHNPHRLVARVSTSARTRKGTIAMSHFATISTTVNLSLVVPGDEPLPVDATLEYDVTDPFAVHLIIAAGDVPVRWSFARDLLIDGVKAPAGEGDVRIIPVGGRAERRVRVVLTSPDGAATLEAPLAEMVQFLSATYVAVPSGSEADLLDIDALIAQLIAE
jgi:hypothetical protein